MQQLLNDFHAALHDEEKSAHTIAAYVSDVRRFLAVRDTPLEALSSAEILVYKEFLAAEYEVTTCNRKLVALSRFLTFARQAGLAIPPVPIRLFAVHQRHIHWYVTEAEVQRLIRAAEARADWRAAAIFAGLFYSGARVSELLQIRTVEATQNRVTIVGKGRKTRTLYLSNAHLRRTWAQYREVRQGDGCPFFFAGRRGRLTRQTVSVMIRTYAGQVRPRLKREKAHAHAFRHGCAIWLKQAKGCGIDQVADILGHRSLDTTRIYFRDTEEDLLKIMQ